MQLFPPTESPLLRNRLTHTLEVADIAANIAMHLNEQLRPAGWRIDAGIVATAALAHDLGHPPFGHSGEKALHSFMNSYGGFEGNAQSLRIISRLENRIVEEFPAKLAYTEVYKNPLGLNLLARTIAAVIKYDELIPNNYAGVDSKGEPKIKKGYYEEDKPIVDFVKRHVIRHRDVNTIKLKTLENQIMDIADDIAYSTYDLEDCLIAGISNPADLMSADNLLLEEIGREVNETLEKHGYQARILPRDVPLIFFKLFKKIVTPSPTGLYVPESLVDQAAYFGRTYREAKAFADNPLLRRKLTEGLISHAISSIFIRTRDDEEPALTTIDIATPHRLFIAALRAYNYRMIIQSSRLQVHQARAFEIIGSIANKLYAEPLMLPPHAREQLRYYLELAPQSADEGAIDGDGLRRRKARRFICDHIASLTDLEALDLYAKLASSDTRTVFGM